MYISGPMTLLFIYIEFNWTKKKCTNNVKKKEIKQIQNLDIAAILTPLVNQDLPLLVDVHFGVA